MEDRFITLAIHTEGKALVLKHILDKNGIEVHLEAVDDTLNGYHVRIAEKNLPKALTIMEGNRLFSYNDPQTQKIDDGRKRILVAVDFSKYSLNACYVAFKTAEAIDAKVKILHVYHNMYFPTSLPFSDTLKKENDVGLLDKARKHMLDLCCKIDQSIRDGELPSVNYSYSIREGIVEEEIDLFTKEYKPKLLILGIKGKDNNAFILGNVTADIIEMTNVPVLAVPEELPLDLITDIKHMVYLTNLQEKDLSSLDTLVSLLYPLKDVRVTLLHLNIINQRGDKWPEAELVGMKEYFAKKYPRINVEYKLIDTPNMMEAITDFIKTEKVSVVALNTRKRNLFGRIFAPSMSRKLMLRLEVAILVLRG